jgi:hypothetical protein
LRELEKGYHKPLDSGLRTALTLATM